MEEYHNLENKLDVKIPTCRNSTNCGRIPNLYKIISSKQNTHMSLLRKFILKKKHFLINENMKKREKNNGAENAAKYHFVMLSICISFFFGLAVGAAVAYSQETTNADINIPILHKNQIRNINSYKNNSNKVIETLKDESKHDAAFTSVSFTDNKYDAMKLSIKDIYPKSITENMRNILKDKETLKTDAEYATDNTTDNIPKNTVLYNDIYWGSVIEDALPKGYDIKSATIWEKYVDQSEIVKMELGCGRMQNRLVTFSDGLQACVRYRHNNDQIQGEIFSFYLGKHLELENFAPSVLKIVDVKDTLWKNVANDIAEASWKLNKAVVLTQFIPDLNPAMIPVAYRPDDRHLNKFDIKDMTDDNKNKLDSIIISKLKKKPEKRKENFSLIDSKLNKISLEKLVELAQWSDLIIFDFLTANLDRIVNNLFNHQWNINIMDAPAHNLAKKMDNGLLVFLDNESSLLHGYRLLKKYDVYHNLMLDHLCVFRKSTVDLLKQTYDANNIGVILNDVFKEKNNAIIRDTLPQFPSKNAKILQERIGKVLSKVDECKQHYTVR